MFLGFVVVRAFRTFFGEEEMIGPGHDFSWLPKVAKSLGAYGPKVAKSLRAYGPKVGKSLGAYGPKVGKSLRACGPKVAKSPRACGQKSQSRSGLRPKSRKVACQVP
jgi:hypothetical protein